jgi:hypothetical protein
MMVPPIGFIEQAVAQGLALALAEEQLVSVESRSPPHNDVRARPPPRSRRRHDSAVIDMRGMADCRDIRESSKR